MAQPSQSEAPAKQAQVLTKAVVRASEKLGVPQATLSHILGVSTATVSRLCSGKYFLAPDRKEWEFALLFVRLFRSLDSLVGSGDTAQGWMNSDNTGLNGKPIKLVESTEGLVRVVHYLDASRGLV